MMASPLRALYEARGSRTFWVLFATFFVCGLSTNGLIQTHWVRSAATMASRRLRRPERSR